MPSFTRILRYLVVTKVYNIGVVQNFLFGNGSEYDILMLDEESTLTAAYLGKALKLNQVLAVIRF